MIISDVVYLEFTEDESTPPAPLDNLDPSRGIKMDSVANKRTPSDSESLFTSSKQDR
jgi:hypothetical protein